MSDQTPNSSEDLGGAEPSMEDILASIRKIISEDEPVALESPEDLVVPPVVDFPPVSDVELGSNLVASNPARNEAGSVDLNIDEVLASIDDFEPEVAAEAVMAEPAAVVEAAEPVETAGDEFDDEIFSALGMDIPLESDAVDPQEEVNSVIEAPALDASDFDLDDLVDSTETAGAFDSLDIPTPEDETTSEVPVVSDDDITMDALLEDILATPPAASEPADAVDDFLTSFDDEAVPEASIGVKQDPDLELVKSLMADLADNPEPAADVEELAAEQEDWDELLAIPKAEAESVLDNILADMSGDEPETLEFDAIGVDETVAESPAETPSLETSQPEAVIDFADTSPQEEDILGDILNMTLEDELSAHPEDITVPDNVLSADEILADEQSNIAENVSFDLDALLDDEPDVVDSFEDIAAVEPIEADPLPSLADIAAAAEADAVQAETSPLAVLGATAGLAAVGAAVLTDEPQAEIEPEIELAPQVEAEAPIVSEPIVSAPDVSEIETAEEAPTPQTNTQQIVPQETPMPVKAVNTDVILDQVTETATAGAFAELNQVVEDKAVFNERGPRIGDLVQEALRPMLKEWLDANLKGIVERAVTKEVKRISSGK